MENALCGAGALLLVYGLASLGRLVAWTRVPRHAACTTSEVTRPRRILGAHGELGACGLLVVVTTAGFFFLVRWLLRIGGVDEVETLAILASIVLGGLAAAALTQALVDLSRAQTRCADLEAVVMGALRKIDRLDAERRTAAVCLARALREKEEAEAREQAERHAHELDLLATSPATRDEALRS